MDPRGGGPIAGIVQLGRQLLAEGHRSEVITLDAANEAIADFPGPVHALGPSRGGYRYNAGLVPWLQSHVAKYDAVIVNGLWQYHSFGAWRALAGGRVPYYVFPHGMLDPWFRHTYPLKHFKKSLYWPWAEYRVLRDARAVLFTCEEERRLARESFSLYRARERVVPYGIGAASLDSASDREAFLAAHPELRQQRVWLFLGRLHEKKGCDLLIQAFATVASQDSRLRLVMAGPDQSGWAASLQHLAQSLGVADRITWPGMLGGAQKWGALRTAEVFILPSHQENFGIAVAEALSCALPVLISDKVNIWREIVAGEAGFVDSDDLEGTRRLLTRWLGVGDPARSRMRHAALRLFEKRFTVAALTRDLLGLFAEDALGSPALER